MAGTRSATIDTTRSCAKFSSLRRILDDHFICTFGTDKPLNKEEFIKLIVGDELLSQDATDATVVVNRDAAVIVDTYTVRGTENGLQYTRVIRITATYIKRHGRWVALAEHVASNVL
jgi:hypothetical protein